MHTLLYLTVLVTQSVVFVTSTAPAPLLGPGYPAPTNFTGNSSLIGAAWSNFTATIDSYIQTNDTLEGLVPDLGSYTFSIGAFSINDPSAAESLQYHHTGPDVKASEIGSQEANANSIYRAESITKVFTVYLALIEIGSIYWERPITDFVPGIAAFANKTAPDPISVVDWKSVTLGALAGQIAGIPRDTALLNSDLLASHTTEQLVAMGLPPFNAGAALAVDPCAAFVNTTGTVTTCPEGPYIQAVTRRAPTFLPWSTPIYTNMGFALLSLALENITGRGFVDMFQEDMFNPLDMLSTSLTEPTNLTNAIIPGGKKSPASAAFASTTTNALGSGAIYSSINDLAKFGLSILNSTLLSPIETRKWLKPITHTASLQLSVGRPWEIFRIAQPLTGRINDLYAKEGDGTGYSSYLILSPDHAAGFSILIASDGNTSPAIANTVLADTLTAIVVPALEAEAAAAAARRFAGKYVYSTSAPSTSSSSNSTSAPQLNSSLTLTFNPSYGPGLKVSSWISNNTDMFTWLSSAAGDELSLFETDLSRPSSSSSAPCNKEVAFRGTFGSSKYRRDGQGGVGPFTDQVTNDVAWEDVDSLSYGGVGLDLFVFTVDQFGEVVAVSPVATGVVLERVR